MQKATREWNQKTGAVQAPVLTSSILAWVNHAAHADDFNTLLL